MAYPGSHPKNRPRIVAAVDKLRKSSHCRPLTFVRHAEMLARRTGLAWAKRMLNLQRLLEQPPLKEWPGSIEHARLLAEEVAADEAVAADLAAKIQDCAAKEWRALVLLA
jgi:hypothetical protein